MTVCGAIGAAVAVAGTVYGAVSSSQTAKNESSLVDPLRGQRAEGLAAILPALEDIMANYGLDPQIFDTLAKYTGLEFPEAVLPPHTDVEKISQTIAREMIDKGLKTPYDQVLATEAQKQMGLGPDYYFAPNETNLIRTHLLGETQAPLKAVLDLMSPEYSNLYKSIFADTVSQSSQGGRAGVDLMMGSGIPAVTKEDTFYNTILNTLRGQQGLADITAMTNAQKLADTMQQAGTNILGQQEGGAGKMALVNTYAPFAANERLWPYQESTEALNLSRRLWEALGGALNIAPAGTTTSTRSSKGMNIGDLMSGIGTSAGKMADLGKKIFPSGGGSTGKFTPWSSSMPDPSPLASGPSVSPIYSQTPGFMPSYEPGPIYGIDPGGGSLSGGSLPASEAGSLADLKGK